MTRILRLYTAAAIARVEDALSAASMRLTLWRRDHGLLTAEEQQPRRDAWRPPAVPRDARPLVWQRGGEA